MLGVDSCFFNLYDNSLPENQTKRGEIYPFRKILKVLVYVFCSKRSDPQKHLGNYGEARGNALFHRCVLEIARLHKGQSLMAGGAAAGPPRRGKNI